MLTKRIYIDRVDWVITWMVSVEPSDIVAVMLEMENLRFPYNQMKSARDIVQDDSRQNWGLTSVNRPLRNMIILVGKQTSFQEFWRTLTHESAHALSVICENEYIPFVSEDSGYLQEDIIGPLADIIVEHANHYEACRNCLASLQEEFL